jgi:ABC-2 type transport system permease protein
MRIWNVFTAEWRAIFPDHGALLILVGAVITYSFFYTLPYMPQVLKETRVAVVDMDQTALSRMLVRMADAHELVEINTQCQSLVEAEQHVRNGESDGILFIPRGFSRQIMRGEQTVVSIYADAGYFLIYRQLLTGALESVGTMSAGIKIQRLEARGVSPERAMAIRDPLSLVALPLFNPSQGYATYVVPAALVLFLQQTLLIGIGLVRVAEAAANHFA